MLSPDPCPHCGTPLTRVAHEPGYALRCATCGGAAVTQPLLRKHADPARVDALWALARAPSAGSRRRCPGCRAPMRSFHVGQSDGSVELDACLICYVLWFDANELTRLGLALRPAVTAPRAVVDFQLQTLAAQGRERNLELATSALPDVLEILLRLL